MHTGLLRGGPTGRVDRGSLPARLLQALPLGQQGNGILGLRGTIVGFLRGDPGRCRGGNFDGLVESLDQPGVDIDLSSRPMISLRGISIGGRRFQSRLTW